jgi:predicted phage terminase large subunit-like protein
MILRPQKGPQETFLASAADIAIFGGAAGGGKSYGLLLEALRHTGNKDFGAVIFRRTTPQIFNEGALWDEAGRVYTPLRAEPRKGDRLYAFPSGATVGFAHLQYDDTVLDFQGSQIPLVGFDELPHFEESQFWYMLSRNRSMCGVRPYVRATCNPDADSWVAKFIAWWIDQDTGFPIPERAGVLRWFIRLGNVIQWADSPDGLPQQTTPDGQVVPPKSVTFIPSKLTDNRALMAADPGYYANLLALPMVERERLLHGNWKIRPAAGLYFQRAWCEVVDAVPRLTAIGRGWDLAATPETETNDPDWTAGTLMGRGQDGAYYVMDQQWLRASPEKVRNLIRNIASQDGRAVRISLPQDPGQAGKSQALDYVQMLAGWQVEATPEARNPGGNITALRQSAKITRFSPFSAQAEAGNVKVVRGEWNSRWFDELEAFPEAKHDDSADSTARAFSIVGLGTRPLIVSADVLSMLGKR